VVAKTMELLKLIGEIGIDSPLISPPREGPRAHNRRPYALVIGPDISADLPSFNGRGSRSLVKIASTRAKSSRESLMTR
jgi:hypothetical protein